MTSNLSSRQCSPCVCVRGCVCVDVVTVMYCIDKAAVIDCVFYCHAATDERPAGKRGAVQQCAGPRRSSDHGATSCLKHHQGQSTLSSTWPRCALMNVNHSEFYWSKRWWGGSGISWTICKSVAPHSRQITTPVAHHAKPEITQNVKLKQTHKKLNWNLNQPLTFKNCSCVCAYHCEQMSYTQHRIVLIIFPLVMQVVRYYY